MLKYLGLESRINPEQERDAILTFLERYWDISTDPERSIAGVIDYILEAGIKYGVAVQEEQTQEAVDLRNKWIDIYKAAGRELTINKIDFKRTTSDEEMAAYRRLGYFDFETQVNPIETALIKEMAISAQPKGYEAYKQEHGTNTENYEDMNEELEFTGTLELHNFLAAPNPPFPYCLNKGSIYYTEANQGRSPLTELISAVYSQGMNIGMGVVEQKWGTVESIKDDGVPIRRLTEEEREAGRTELRKIIELSKGLELLEQENEKV